MKKIGVLLVFVILISVSFLQVVFAETTFFEGDLGYGDDFIMALLEEEPEIPAGIEISVETETQQPGGGFIRENVVESVCCPIIAESLKAQIKEKQTIEYSKLELEILTNKINEEIKFFKLSKGEVGYILETYEETCDAYYPLLAGLATGRSRNLLILIVMVTAIIILVFFIIIGYMIIHILRKRGYGKKKGK